MKRFEHVIDRALIPFFFIAAIIAIAAGWGYDGIVLMLYAIAVLLERIERQLSRRAGARGESDG